MANRTSLSKKPLALKMSTLKKAVAAKGLTKAIFQIEIATFLTKHAFTHPPSLGHMPLSMAKLIWMSPLRQ